MYKFRYVYIYIYMDINIYVHIYLYVESLSEWGGESTGPATPAKKCNAPVDVALLGDHRVQILADERGGQHRAKVL